MKYTIRVLGISCTIILSSWILAGGPATPPPSLQAQPTPAPVAQASAQPKTTVKIANNSGYNAIITYHYYKIPENNPTHSSATLEKGGTTTPPLELLPNTSFSFSLSAEGIKSPDVQVNPGEFASGFYEIKPPAAPLIIPVIRPAVIAPAAPAPAPVAAMPQPQPTPPTPPAKP